MVATTLNYGALNDSTAALAFSVVTTSVVSVTLFLLARGRVFATTVAVVLALGWTLFLLPDVQYYLDSRTASAGSIVEPFERQHYIRAYFLVFMPLLFLFLSLLLRRRTI